MLEPSVKPWILPAVIPAKTNAPLSNSRLLISARVTQKLQI
jgi:hypothetical protein